MQIITSAKVKQQDGNMSAPIPFGVESVHVKMTNKKNLEQVLEEDRKHISDTNNPHKVTKKQVGLENVGNYKIATQAEAEAGNSNTVYTTPLRVKEEINKIGVMSDGNTIIKVGGTQPSPQAGKTIIWINTAE